MIDPCGYKGMEVTQLGDLGIDASTGTISEELQQHLERLLKSPPT
jgi:lipoate-protein ligase B